MVARDAPDLCNTIATVYSRKGCGVVGRVESLWGDEDVVPCRCWKWRGVYWGSGQRFDVQSGVVWEGGRREGLGQCIATTLISYNAISLYYLEGLDIVPFSGRDWPGSIPLNDLPLPRFVEDGLHTVGVYPVAKCPSLVSYKQPRGTRYTDLDLLLSVWWRLWAAYHVYMEELSLHQTAIVEDRMVCDRIGLHTS